MNLSKQNSKLHSVWNNMKQRCNNINDKDYKYYGSRGISVCSEWNKFINFLNWSKESGYKEGLQIDRKDNNGNYCPNNCHYVTAKENTGVGKRRISSKNTSGYIGISYDKVNNKYKSTIRIDNRNKTIGRYNTIEEALAARIKAEVKLFESQITNL